MEFLTFHLVDLVIEHSGNSDMRSLEGSCGFWLTERERARVSGS